VARDVVSLVIEDPLVLKTETESKPRCDREFAWLDEDIADTDDAPERSPGIARLPL
jgi:hypothetical protein